jgi:hypothetical protein
MFLIRMLWFFGATEDLAYKKIFPALQAMVKRGHLNVPVIGVAKAGWNLNQLRERAQDSVEKHGGFNPAAFDKLCSLLRYVDGDYKDPATFQTLRKALGAGQHPAQPNYCRFQISPDVTLAFGVNVLAPAEDTGDAVELWRATTPAQTKWMLTSGCSAMQWPAMRVYSLGRTMSKRPGALSILCSKQALLRSTITNQIAGVRVRSKKEFYPLVAGITRG